jgi:sugar phosphate isomerase/epimerase
MSPAPWPLAAYLPSLPLEFAEAVTEAAALGFGHVSVAALADRPAEHLEALADSGLIVLGAELGHSLSADHSLDSADVDVRRETLNLLQRQAADAARLGATCAWLIAEAGQDESARVCFREGITLLADYAARRMVRLCIVGRQKAEGSEQSSAFCLLPSALVDLLLDVEEGVSAGSAAMIRQAGARLGHVRLCCSLRPAELKELGAALREVRYAGGVSLRGTQTQELGAAREAVLRAFAM